jgi:hypothetical protein
MQTEMNLTRQTIAADVPQILTLEQLLGYERFYKVEGKARLHETGHPNPVLVRREETG